VAASVVLLAAVVLRTGGGGLLPALGGEAAQRAAQPSGAPSHAAAVPLEREDRNYDELSARQLGQAVASAGYGADLTSGQAAGAGPVPSTSLRAAAPETDHEAVDCLRKAGATFSDEDRLARLILARYQGRPAYLGVFLEGPAGKRPGTVAVWVVGAGDCRIRLLTSERI
jgi:hypothetical protein